MADVLSQSRIETLESRCLFSVGDLNLAFGGGDGRIRGAAPVSGGGIVNVVAQPDGKFVIGGYAESKGKKTVWLERLDAKGNLDKTFGNNGLVVTAPIADDNAQLADFARQSDGKFVLITSTTHNGAQMWRYTSAGKIDTSFGGGDGIITTNVLMKHLAILPNGKIAADNYSQVLEFNSDGTVNSGFGTKGVFTVTSAFPGMSGMFLENIVAQKDNKLLVTTPIISLDTQRSDAAVLRITTAGKPDTTFNHDGLRDVEEGLGENRGPRGIALQSNGNIILAAEDDDDRGYVFGLKPDGSDIPGFKGGPIGFSSGIDDEYAGVTIFGNDNIALIGAAPDPNTGQIPHVFDIVGYTANGVETFDKVIDFAWVDGKSDDEPVAATMTSDGNLVIVGNTGQYSQTGGTQLEIASLQGKSGGPSDKIPVVFGDKQVTVTGTANADTINVFTGVFGQVYVEYNGNRTYGYDATNDMGDPNTLVVNGGDGNDHIQNFSNLPSTLNGQGGSDTLVGGSGADTFQGGGGNDTADYSQRGANLSLSLDNVANDGAAGEKDNIMSDVETVLGGSGNDKIVGDPFANLLKGEAGNDTIYGGAGNDTLDGGLGHDSLFGQDNDDLLLAQDGQTDTLDGGTGTDKAQRDNSASVKDSVLNNESFI